MVTALARSPASAQALAQQQIAPVAGDLDQPASLAALNLADARVYYFAPPPAQGHSDPRMQHFLHALADKPWPRRVVYLSTTGVYGDCQGAWVTEDRPPQPTAARAQRRWDAEQQLQAFMVRTGVAVVILRVPGIYGPDRLPCERLQQRLPVLRTAEAPWSNRIHIDDLVQACLAAADRGTPGAVYNVADNEPTTMTDYFNRVADACGLPRPPQVSRADAAQQIDAGMRSYLEESRRIDNTRLRTELGVVLGYPSLTEGLAAVRVRSQAAGPPTPEG